MTSQIEEIFKTAKEKITEAKRLTEQEKTATAQATAEKEKTAQRIETAKRTGNEQEYITASNDFIQAEIRENFHKSSYETLKKSPISEEEYISYISAIDKDAEKVLAEINRTVAEIIKQAREAQEKISSYYAAVQACLKLLNNNTLVARGLAYKFPKKLDNINNKRDFLENTAPLHYINDMSKDIRADIILENAKSKKETKQNG